MVKGMLIFVGLYVLTKELCSVQEGIYIDMILKNVVLQCIFINISYKNSLYPVNILPNLIHILPFPFYPQSFPNHILFPGTSKTNWSSQTLRQSSQKLPQSRSKSALTSRELNKSRHLECKRSGSFSSPEKKKSSVTSNLNLQKSKQKLSELNISKKVNSGIFHKAPMSSTKLRHELQNKSGVWHKTADDKVDDKKKKVTLSSMDLNIREYNDPRENSDFRSCSCASAPDVTEFITRWDNLVLLLVCAVILAFMLSTPMSFFFGRQI